MLVGGKGFRMLQGTWPFLTFFPKACSQSTVLREPSKGPGLA